MQIGHLSLQGSQAGVWESSSGAEAARSVAKVLVFSPEPSVSPSASIAFGGTFVLVPKSPKAVAVTCSLCDMAQKGS